MDSVAINIHYDVTVVPDFLRKIKRMRKTVDTGFFLFLSTPLRAQVGGYLVPRKDQALHSPLDSLHTS